MLVIDPEECIDCGVCVPECPAEAIYADTEPEAEAWLEVNAKYAAKWPNIIVRRDVDVTEADKFKNKPNKFKKYFSSNPGKGEETS